MFLKNGQKIQSATRGVDAVSLVRVWTVLFVLCRYRVDILDIV